jgi:hypothetical protein
MEKLHADLKYWQRQLRLDGLDINLSWFVERDDEGLVGGDCRAELETDVIWIRICHPDEMSKEIGKDYFHNDFEVILVHELVHAVNSTWQCGKVFEKMTENNPIFSLWEQSIHTIAEALVRGRRGMTR